MLLRMPLPLVHLAGTPFDQGHAHGLALGDCIADNIALYYDRLDREAHLTRTEVRERAAHFAALLDGTPYGEAMRGLARGAQADPIDIVVLNARYELLYYQYGVCGIGQPDGCTAFAVLPTHSASRHLLLGQNWDWIPEVRGALLHTQEPDGLETLAFTEAGIVGAKIGLNSAGLGLTINGLISTTDEWSRPGLPFHARCYEVLRARTLDEAIGVVERDERACAGNFLLAQTPDRAVNLEAAPLVVGQRRPANGALVHTNHFVDPEALGVAEPETERRPHTYARLDRMQDLLADRAPVAIGDLEAILRDHDNHPDSICRHENPLDPPEEWYVTVVSVVMDLEERSLRITDGSPCEHLYETYSIPHTALLGR